MTQEQTPALKACPNPWCDRPASLRVDIFKIDGKQAKKRVWCPCNQVGPGADTEAEAIAAWNTRTPDPAVAGLVEALELARNRLQRAALEMNFASPERFECGEWALEATQALKTWSAQ